MQRIHCLQLWWNLSDTAMKEELHERPLYRRFTPRRRRGLPDESTIPRFSHLLKMVHGEERDVLADAGYQGVTQREEAQGIEAN